MRDGLFRPVDVRIHSDATNAPAFLAAALPPARVPDVANVRPSLDPPPRAGAVRRLKLLRDHRHGRLKRARDRQRHLSTRSTVNVGTPQYCASARTRHCDQQERVREVVLQAYATFEQQQTERRRRR
jgi:hypothetical protein